MDGNVADLLLEKFGGHLRILSEEKGLSLRQFATLSSIDNSKISKIERGQVNVTLLTIFQLAEGLSVPPSAMMGFYAPELPPKKRRIQDRSIRVDAYFSFFLKKVFIALFIALDL